MLKIPLSPVNYPLSVKKGFFFFLLAWVCHFVFLFKLFEGAVPPNILRQQIAIAAILIVLLLYLKNWARVICIVGNILLILAHLLFAMVFHEAGKGSFPAMAVVVIAFLGLSIYYWIKPETVQLFKAHTGVKKEPEG